MLIDEFVPLCDACERHSIRIAAPSAEVYTRLYSVDFGKLMVVRLLLALRSLPAVLAGKRNADRNRAWTLDSLAGANFGKLAENHGREVVFGVTGKFWRLAGNIAPFSKESWSSPVLPGLARAAWNFSVSEPVPGATLLTTETRIVCGDSASKRKFRLYWLFVRPFSGLIRLLMLRAVRRVCEPSQ